MDNEDVKPRDVEADLVEITSRLGDPDATFRTNPSSVAWRFVLGTLIVVAGAALHYVMWTGALPWPNRVKVWIILLAAMFVGPGVGLYLITFAVRGMKLWVLAYPTGLFVWHRGHVVAFPWDEIKAVQIAGHPSKAVLNKVVDANGVLSSVWYDLSRSGRKIFGTTVTITRFDGEQASLPSTLVGFPDLAQRVQAETFARLFPTYWRDLLDGRTLEFGPVSCSVQGIANKKELLPWPEVDALEREADKLHVRRAGKKRAWAKLELSEFVNLHVFMGVAEAMRRVRPGV